MVISLLTTLVALAEEPQTPALPPTEVRVVSVYDGDTFTLETGHKVRLQWVNTPELRPMEAYGLDARDAARSLVDQEIVTLTYDAKDAVDGYGRLVASASFDGTDLATHLISQGLGHLFIIPPLQGDLTHLEDAQRAAKADRLGIWSTDRYQGPLHITSFHANARGPDHENVHGEYLRVCNVSDAPFDMSQITVLDAQDHQWSLPAVIVPVGHTVKIHSGRGEPQADPSKQLAVYLQTDGPVWNNDGDRVRLQLPDGTVVDSRSHKGKK